VRSGLPESKKTVRVIDLFFVQSSGTSAVIFAISVAIGFAAAAGAPAALAAACATLV
jgi:hypothetical protein